MIYGDKHFQNYQKMLKMKKWLAILENSPQYLFLASGVKNGEGFWFVGGKDCDESILEDKILLDCHRKELVGNESAKDILLAINLNINNLLNELKNKNYLLGCIF